MNVLRKPKAARRARCGHGWTAERDGKGRRIGPWKCSKCGKVVRNRVTAKILDYLKSRITGRGEGAMDEFQRYALEARRIAKRGKGRAGRGEVG